jgi:ABC-type lipoprotein export system ATPase subunit
MIELQHISKWYKIGGKPAFILKDINLTVNEGEFISIMGPSGSGKSTLLNIIGMLDLPSEGQYQFLGQSVYDLKKNTGQNCIKRTLASSSRLIT